MPGSPIIAIYCRTAGRSDDYIGFEKQELACRQYCAVNGLIVSNVYREVFSGHQYRERPLLQQLRMHCRDGSIQGIVVYSLDRLSRSPVHLAILLEEMEKYHVTLYVATEKVEETIMGRFLLMLLIFLADMEREKALDF